MTVLDRVIGIIHAYVYNETDLLRLDCHPAPETDRIQFSSIFEDLLQRSLPSSLSSLFVFRNDLLSSGFANQISSRLGVGTEQRRKPVSIADGCFRFV